MSIPLLGGFEFDHSSVTLRVLALTFEGIQDYKVGSEVSGEKMLYGTSKKPRARTRGTIGAKPWSFTMYAKDFNRLLALPVFLLTGYHDTMFDFQIEKKEGLNIQIDKLVSARILGFEETSKEGGDAVMVAVNGSALSYERDNFLPTALSLGF